MLKIKYHHIRTGLVYLLGFFFAYAFLVKVQNFSGFEIKLAQSEIISYDLITLVSYVVPAIELAFFLLLFFDVKRSWVLTTSLFYLITVTIYLLALNEFSLFNGCSCGGVFDLTYAQHVFLNFTFIILNAIAVFMFMKKQQPHNEIALSNT